MLVSCGCRGSRKGCCLAGAHQKRPRNQSQSSRDCHNRLLLMLPACVEILYWLRERVSAADAGLFGDHGEGPVQLALLMLACWGITAKG